MVIKSKVGATHTCCAVSWEIVPSCLVKTLSIFTLMGLLASCGGGGSDGGQATSILENTIQLVDATSVGPDLKGLEFSDQNGNEVTTFISDTLPDNAVEIVDGISLGMPDGYEIITNEFVELTYPDAIKDQWQTVRVTSSGVFNTVMVFDPVEMDMSRTPYLELGHNEIEFKVQPISGKITFSLINITE